MTDKTVAKRLAIERRVIRKLIRVAKVHGFSLTRIWDGECNERPTNEQEALDVVFSVDECKMVFRHHNQDKSHSAYIVLGNDGWDCIADSSTGDLWDDVMAEMDAYTTKIELSA